ncbi:MAG: DUF2304 domain-containing protein [Candidatus Andersenbacteria bacterium]|nr:DUF2304 domain-containing protein [Candidatus Andersenbacteria bacterium]
MTLIAYLIDGSIPQRLQYIAIVLSISILIFTLNLIRQGKLKEGYSLIWFFIALATVIFSVFARILDSFASLISIAYAPAALLLILVGGLFLLAIHSSVLFTAYDKRIRELAQDHAILKQEIESTPK